MIFFFIESNGPKLSDASNNFSLVYCIFWPFGMLRSLITSKLQKKNYKTVKTNQGSKWNRNISTKPNKWDNQSWTMAWVATLDMKISGIVISRIHKITIFNGWPKAFSLRVRNFTFRFEWHDNGGSIVCVFFLVLDFIRWLPHYFSR